MRVFEFILESISDEPGWEMDIYKSNDLNGTWCSERSCLEAVVVDQQLADPSVAMLMFEIELDKLLLENNIFVMFVEE